MNHTREAMRKLIQEATVVSDRLEKAAEEIGLLVPEMDDDDYGTSKALEFLRDSDDIHEFPESFGNIVGGELFVHGPGFMQEARRYLVDVMTVDGDGGDQPVTDAKYALEFGQLIDKFTADYDDLRTAWSKESAKERDARD